METTGIDREAFAKVVRDAKAPLTPKHLAQVALGSSAPKKVQAAEKTLESLQESGSVYKFPPEQRGRPVRFGSCPPVQWVQRRILDKVRSTGGRVTEKQVKEYLRSWEVKLYDEAVSGLIGNGQLHRLALKRKYLVSSAPTPFDYLLGRHVTAVKEILDRINRKRAEPITLSQLRSFLDGNLDRPTPPGDLTEEMIRAWYDKDVPLRGGVTSVPISWTWKHYVARCKEQGVDPDLSRFHQLLLNLSQSHRIELIPHSRTQEIPPEDVRLALTSPTGEVLYYWRWR